MPSLSHVRIVLSHPSHPGNIGAVARAMKTMGLSHLILINPKAFPHEEASARAAGAEDVLASACVSASLDDALSGTTLAMAVTARPRNLGPEPLLPRDAVEHLLAEAAVAKVALVFGNETSGLSNEDVQRCQNTVHIPANPLYASLNLGAAVQILAYELFVAASQKQAAQNITRQGVSPFSSQKASFDQIEGFYAHLERVMIETAFLNPQAPKRLMQKIRRLFGRAQLEQDEVNILRGILDATQRASANPRVLDKPQT